MKHFKQLTIDELMKLLIKLTRENELQAKEYNRTIDVILKGKQSVSEAQEKISELHKLVHELIAENKSFVQLFKGLTEFSQFFSDYLEFLGEKEGPETEAVKVDAANLDASKNLESKNQEDLNKLLEQYIAEEKYEECAKIRELIKKASK